MLDHSGLGHCIPELEPKPLELKLESPEATAYWSLSFSPRTEEAKASGAKAPPELKPEERLE